MTREEHLDWCKKRAMEYVQRGDLTNAVTSMLSDLGKHKETEPYLKWASLMGIGMLLTKDSQNVVRFIQGFNSAPPPTPAGKPPEED